MASFSNRPFERVPLRNHGVCHTTSDTRPSRFSACNIEKMGVVWLARLDHLFLIAVAHGLTCFSQISSRFDFSKKSIGGNSVPFSLKTWQPDRLGNVCICPMHMHVSDVIGNEWQEFHSAHSMWTILSVWPDNSYKICYYPDTHIHTHTHTHTHTHQALSGRTRLWF